MLNAVMVNAVILSVIMLNAVMLNVVAPNRYLLSLLANLLRCLLTLFCGKFFILHF
jgi:hypothetical protein